MIDPSSTEDESDEDFAQKRKTGKKHTLKSQESEAKELSLPPTDATVVAHPPSRIQEVESKPSRSR